MRKSLRRLGALILALLLAMSVMSATAFATETEADTSKTLTVGTSDADYDDIQAAINAIQLQYEKDESGLFDPTGWTIIVESGTYLQFAIPKEQVGLTIKAADDANVVVTSWTGEANPNLYLGKYNIGDGIAAKGYYNDQGYSYAYYGVYVQAQNVTLQGISFTLGSYGSYWYKACVSDIGGASTVGTLSTGLTIDNCSFSYADGVSSGYGLLIAASSSWTVTNSTFTGLANAIDFMCDNFAVNKDGITISGNEFIECSFAVHGYYSQVGTGAITITNNTLTGTADLYTKIAIQDASSGNGFTIAIADNKLTNALIGTINISSADAAELLADNTFVSNAFVVLSTDTGSASTTTATYYAPASDTGYWKVTGIDDLDVSWGGNPTNTTGTIKTVVSSTNSSDDNHTLSTSAARTFSWFKDAIYWISGAMPTEKVSYPGLDKVIVEDETETTATTAAAGDEIDFKLTSYIPSNLDSYIDYTAVYDEDTDTLSAVGAVKTGATYVLTFHDVMDKVLSLDSDSFAVTLISYVLEDGLVTETVKDTIELDSAYYTITIDETSDGCTFEVAIDLLALYTDGIIAEEDFGATDVIVTYTATLSESVAAGSYKNTAWVSYPSPNDSSTEDTSEKVTVTIDTFGISVFKYDSTATSTGLAGAKFELTDADGNVIANVTTDENGYATIDGLDVGTYYLTETEAPDGYVCSSEKIEITVSSDASTDNVVSVEIANAPIPSTGGMGTTMYTMIGGSILIVAGAIFLIGRKKREEA